jgi:glycosyltransferase involved in cell wall biosynthesis
MPKVSVIVPCYNLAKYLPETLNSVLNQTYSDWECIIINDGSKDNTEELALEWLIKDKRFKYVSKENGGVSDARNYGINTSVGEYILPLDGDDLIERTYLEKAVRVLEQRPDVGIVYCKAMFFGGKKGEWKLPKFNLRRNLTSNVIFCSAFFRRIDFLDTPGYNKNMIYGNEDWDLWLSLLEKEVNVYRIPEILFHYRIRPNSRSMNLIDGNIIESYSQVIKNHPALFNKYFNNSNIIIDYLKFKISFPTNNIERALYILHNIRLKIAIFYLKCRITRSI